ncbi:MAG: hypothetical protein AABX84_02720 [Nanoarchaeota archaeon]
MVKKKLKGKAKKKVVKNKGRRPSKKSKESKVRKLIRLFSKSRSKKKRRK